jgi:hypothetical protein
MIVARLKAGQGVRGPCLESQSVKMVGYPAFSLRQPCFGPIVFYVLTMKLTKVQDQAIQARMALLVGAETFDRLFAGIRFDEVDGPLLYVYARNEDVATEIEDEFSLHIAIVASRIVEQQVELVVVMPKVLQ